MAASSCGSVLGSGKANTARSMKKMSIHIEPLVTFTPVVVVSDACGRAAGVTRSKSQC